MSTIKKVKGRQVFDSRGNPTVEAEVILKDDSVGRAIVPSGASTGRYEANELRDKNEEYLNKSVFEAVENINSPIAKSILAPSQSVIASSSPSKCSSGISPRGSIL